MQQSFWGVFVVSLGILAIVFVYIFQSVTNVDEHNYNLLKETTEAAMVDAVDLATYRREGIIRIDREKFVENFVRRVAETASLGRTYNIRIYDVVETPPKVSVQISSTDKGNAGTEIIEFDIVNRISAILETPY
ncbi:MAG: DUF5411 family protein [Bacilli bacterium]|nr:DUF5411 family protein [Bacilli bacterium]